MNDAYGKRYYGKYRGTVSNNKDPEQKGRLELRVPDVLGDNPSTWAVPCVPLAGPGSPAMGIYLVPPIGAGVWVEFEQGDVNHPIWVGCFWADFQEIPSSAQEGSPTSPNIVIHSYGGHSIVISDMPGSGGITLKSSGGAKIEITDRGITIDNGQGAKITLNSNSVDINDGALTIT